jgi:hypothetical protein
VTGESHAKFVIVIRSEFGSDLLGGFTNAFISVLERLLVDTRGNIKGSNAVKSDIVQTVSAAGLLKYRLLYN